MSVYEEVKRGIKLVSSQKEIIKNHYRENLEDYLFWSPAGNMHFGYWRLGVGFFNREQQLKEMNQQVLNLSDLKDGGHLLDLGCGLGALLRSAHEANPKLKLHGITMVDEQIAKAQAFGENDFDYRLGDFRCLPYKEESMDACTAMESSCYASGSSKNDMIAQAAKVLKPGGSLVIADFFIKADVKLGEKTQEILKKWGDNWGIVEIGRLDEVAEALGDNGFEEIEITNISKHLIPSLIQVPFLVIVHLLNLLIKGKCNKSRWEHMQSCFLCIPLAIQMHKFAYSIISAKKVKNALN
ncbi:methyltransferase domain-containing protein [Lentisphaera profundi]|uniref:Methyltransferase domain-containing protein n=1 Tax=Lentisphaera profundi TaxID=1658616 RepID=A0ABY7VU67_9BACT|nr:class I SAM-dependent methyltransferase [Lentisphaera profundi]WDE96371.1 methyltransferase domain-containing protein [Lentisphaera profundi]